MSAIGKQLTSGGCGAVGNCDSARDTDETGAAYNSPRHKKRASPPSPRGPGPRRALPLGVRGGFGVRAPGGSRAPTPPPAGQAECGVGKGDETPAELQRLRLALAAAEDKNAQLLSRVAELSAALAAARASSAQQEDNLKDHITELEALQQRCAGWAPLDVDDMEPPSAEPEAVPPPQHQEIKTVRGAPKIQLPFSDDNDDCADDDSSDSSLSPRTRGALLPPWSPRTQGAEVALPCSPRSLAASVPLPSVHVQAAEVPLPDTPRSQGLSSPRQRFDLTYVGAERHEDAAKDCCPGHDDAGLVTPAGCPFRPSEESPLVSQAGYLKAHCPGDACTDWAGSEASLATACASPPESPRLGAAEAEPPRGAGMGMVASAAVRLWGLLRRGA